MRSTRKNSGYVSIATVLVVGFVLLSVGMSVILNSINETQSSYAETRKEQVLGFVESCIQDGLIRLNKYGTVPASIVLPDGTCTVTINSQVGNTWDFTTTGSLSGHRKTIRVVATRTSTIAITSWLEL